MRAIEVNGNMRHAIINHVPKSHILCAFMENPIGFDVGTHTELPLAKGKFRLVYRDSCRIMQIVEHETAHSQLQFHVYEHVQQ